MAGVKARLAQARRRMKLAVEAESEQRKQEREDLGFQTPDGHWTADAKQNRLATTIAGIPIPARPMLSVAPVDEPIQLVQNQARSAHLACTFRAQSKDATDDTAEVLQGLYDCSANDSRADNARLWAYDRSTWCGRGVYRLDKCFDPDGGHPFDQKIIWKRLKYQEAYYRDPSVEEMDGSDALWAFVVEAHPMERYTSKYSKSKLAKFTNEGIEELVIDEDYLHWFGGDDEDTRTVKVAEYWRVEVSYTTYRLYDDGNAYTDGDDIPAGVTLVEGDGAQSKDEEVRRVFWSKINGYEELEPEQEWDGQYIPLIPVVWKELIPFDGKMRYAGMMTNAKDPARMIDYSASGAVEMAALEPKAPWIWDERQIAGYKPFWEQSNVRNFAGLPYNAVIDGVPTPPPQRVQVDTSRLGPNMQILSMSGSMLQSSMSTFDPALGKQPTAHRSGRALEALQGQSIEANSGGLSNLANVTLMYEARVWLDLAPHVYDRPGRVVQILQGGKTKPIMLRTPYVPHPETGQPQAVPQIPNQPLPPNALHYDLSQGTYGIAVTIGKSSPTVKAQGNDALTQIIQAEPAVLPIVGPLWAQTLDVPFSRELADLLQRDRDHRMPWLRDPSAAPDVNSLQAENQALKGHVQELAQQLQTETAKIQLQNQGKLQVTAIQEHAESDRADKDREAKLAVAALSGKFETLQNAMQLLQAEIARIGSQQHDVALAHTQNAHDMAMGAAEHEATMAQADQAHAQALTEADQANAHTQDQAAQQAALQPPVDNSAGQA